MQRLEQHAHAVVVLSCVEVRVSQVDVQARVPSAVELLETILVKANCLRKGSGNGWSVWQQMSNPPATPPLYNSGV